jgi:beta-lactamase hcpA (cysteine-rich 28 kDaprotein)
MKKIVLLIFLTLNLIALTTNPKIKIPQTNSCNIEDNCIDFSRKYSDDEYKRLFGVTKVSARLKI